MATLFLRTIEQVALFKLELAGQISDGHWENSRPYDHWQVWCRAKVRVAPIGLLSRQPVVGRNFYAKRDIYGLTSGELLSVIGGRMLAIARVTQGLGYEVADKLHWRFNCDDDFAVSPIVPPRADLTGDYWDTEREKLKEFNLGAINTHIMHGNYSKKDLLRDLREIKEAMRTSVSLKDSDATAPSLEVQP